MKKAFWLCLMLIAIYSYKPSLSDATLITFDELPVGTPIDGETIDIVTFNFSRGGVSSTDAAISSSPDGTPLFTAPTVLGRSDGVLGLNFATPVMNIRYAFGLSSTTNVLDGSIITIYDADSIPIGTASGDALILGVFFPEGTVSIDSTTPIVRAEIKFNIPAPDLNSFAMDNLEFESLEPAGCQCPADSSLSCISGTVTDSRGNPIVGAKVRLRGTKRMVTQTNDKGCYIFTDLPYGEYKVRARDCGGDGRRIRGIIIDGVSKVNNQDLQCE